MYDNPLTNWAPGKLARIGFPWHGRVDMNLTASGLPSRLNLPNGAVMTLPHIGSAASTSQLQRGNTMVFRDPRAVATVLTNDEAVQAAAAGAVWRPEAIINETRLAGGAAFTRDFIYHDGAQNWHASISLSGSLVLRSAPVIGRNQEVTEFVRPVTRPFAAADYAPPSGLYTASGFFRVIDQVPDGSRVLAASYRVRSTEGMSAGNSFRQRNERWEATAFYELTISGPAASAAVRMDLVYGRADIDAGYTENTTDALGRRTVLVSTGFGWSTFESGQTATSSASFPVAAAGSFLPSPDWYENGSLTKSQSQARVVGMYYGADRSIRRITFNYAVSSVLAYNTSTTQAGNPASGIGQGGEVFGIQLSSPGDHNFTVNEGLTINSSLSMTLLDNGQAVSSITGSGSTSRTRTWSLTVAVTADPQGIAVTSNTATTSVSGSWGRSTTFDGQLIDQVSGSNSGSSWNIEVRDVSPEFSGGAWEVGVQLQLDPPSGLDARLMLLSPQHYNAQMHALGATAWNLSGSTVLNLENTEAQTCPAAALARFRLPVTSAALTL
jgi:hypothetical protein